MDVLLVFVVVRRRRGLVASWESRDSGVIVVALL